MPSRRAFVALLLLCVATAAFGADPAYLVKDINDKPSAAGSSKPERFLTLGNVVVFEAADSVRSLWRTDGTLAGTFRLGAAPFSKVVWNGRIWMIYYGADTLEVWSTDGTNPPVLGMAIRAVASLTGSPLMAAGDALYFLNGGQMFRTLGLPGTTTQLSSAPLDAIRSWADVNGSLYFSASQNGRNGLWRIGGTSVILVRDAPPSLDSSYFAEITPVGTQVFLYFRASQSASRELWTSDGTYGGTHPIPSLKAMWVSYRPSNIIASATHVYFVGDDGTGAKLWKTDGTDAGTVPVAASLPGAAVTTFSASVIGRLSNGTLLIDGPPLGGASGRGLWSWDGTNTTFLASVSGNAYHDPIVAGTYAIYGVGEELWRSDGTIAGTYSLGRAGTPFNSSWGTALGSSVFFAGVDATFGEELFRTDGTAPGTGLFKDLAVLTYSSSPKMLRRVRGGAVFTASMDRQSYLFSAARDLWFSDGTEAGTVRLRSDVGNPSEAASCGGEVFLTLSTAEAGAELWATDGTSGGTRMVKDLVPGPVAGNPARLVCADDQLFFTTSVSDATTLWKTDGTAAGTLPIREFASAGYSGGGPPRLYAVGSAVYLSISTGTGSRLFRSDGTAPGTVVVKDLPGPVTAGVASGTNFFLTTENADRTDSLWRSDGTPAGTVSFLTDDVVMLSSAFQGEAVFQWNDGYTNRGLCRSSGGTPVCFYAGLWSQMGVRLVNGAMIFNVPDLRRSVDGVYSASVGVGEVENFLAVAGGRAYATGYSNRSLIETDGTSTNTRQILGGAVEEAVVSEGTVFIGREELYAYVLPVVAISMSPGTITSGGQTITITGRGFTWPAYVSVNGAPVNATFVSPTTITFPAPPLGPGRYPVSVTFGNGREMTIDEPLRYACARPTAALEPWTGVLPFGGSTTLRGSGGARCAWFPDTGLDDPGSCTPRAAPAVSTIYTLVVFTENGCASTNHPSVRVGVLPQTPVLSYAQPGSQGKINVSWTLAKGAAAYELIRFQRGASPLVIPVTATFFGDTVAPSTAYLYRVRAVNEDGVSSESNADWSHSVAVASTYVARRSSIRAAHLIALRGIIDDIGVLAGLPPATWTDPVLTPGATPARAAHITELRDRLTAAAAALGRPAPAWPGTMTGSAVAPGAVVKVDPIGPLWSVSN